MLEKKLKNLVSHLEKKQFYVRLIPNGPELKTDEQRRKKQ